MQDEEFGKVVDRYLNNELTADEKENFDKWLNYITDDNAFESISKTELQNIDNRIQKNLNHHISVTRNSIKHKRSFYSTPFLKIAASVIFFAIAFVFLRYGINVIYDRQNFITVECTKGKISKVILPDASIIWLKGASSITYPVQFETHTRNIDMKGEALFEITKDKAHPFVIHCGSLVTEVLGTSFNIKQQSNEIEVRVLTGRVHLTANNTEPVTIYPLQKAVFHQHKNRILKNMKPDSSTSFLTAGTEYNMKFHDTPVNQVVTRIEKKFDVHITTKKPMTNTALLTADLTDQSLQNSITMISQALNIPFAIEN